MPRRTLKNIYDDLKRDLAAKDAEIEARIILEYVLNITPAEIISNEDLLVTQNQIKKIEEIKLKRINDSMPLAYILEEAPFRDLRLFVNRDVLIPRPETELMIDIALEALKSHPTHQLTILDLCTGSGCLAIALKLAFPAAKVYASDISRNALSVAAINARRYDVDIEFVMGDYLDPFLPRTTSPIALPIMRSKPPYFDLIITNPPYVSEEDYKSLEPELYYEPKHALIGFPYASILRDAQLLLNPGGILLAEIGLGQENLIVKLAPEAVFYKDLTSRFRFFSFVKAV